MTSLNTALAEATPLRPMTHDGIERVFDSSDDVVATLRGMSMADRQRFRVGLSSVHASAGINPINLAINSSPSNKIEVQMVAESMGSNYEYAHSFIVVMRSLFLSA